MTSTHVYFLVFLFLFLALLLLTAIGTTSSEPWPNQQRPNLVEYVPWSLDTQHGMKDKHKNSQVQNFLFTLVFKKSRDSIHGGVQGLGIG